jgi:hypothetical protein
MKKQEEVEINIIRVEESVMPIYLVGKSPLIMNRLAEKAKHELLLPAGRKTAAEKAGNLKHDPYQEYRSAAHTFRDPAAPTFLAMPSSAPKRAMASAALDLPGAKKAQIGRLTYVQGEMVGIYGLPKIFMRIVRSADMNKTPDVRTRVIVEHWAALIHVSFVTPIINHTMVASLLAAAGLYIGIGDWRPEKGAGSYGQFTIMPTNKAPEIEHILAAGRDVQIAAMENPEPYDEETAELMSWFQTEVQKKGLGKIA